MKYRGDLVCVADPKGDLPLNIAVSRGDENIVGLLLSKPTLEDRSTRMRGSNGLTPLESALVGGFASIVKKLMVYQADAVYTAARANQFDRIRLCLDLEPGLAKGRWDSQFLPAPLAGAAEAGNTSMVALLLDSGADIKIRDRHDPFTTPLWISAANGHLQLVKLFVQRGADNEQTAGGWGNESSPLWIAALMGHSAIFLRLLEVGAKAEVADDDLRRLHDGLKNSAAVKTIICKATIRGHTDAVRTFAKAGIGIEKV